MSQVCAVQSYSTFEAVISVNLKLTHKAMAGFATAIYVGIWSLTTSKQIAIYHNIFNSKVLHMDIYLTT